VFNVHKDLIKYACKHNATFIVHTHREKKRIESISPRARVLVHPILWSKNYSQGNTVERKVDVKKFFKDVQLPTIGLFGFVSEYKNFEQVIEVALASKAYNVVLAGGTHPTSPAYGKSATKKESSPAKITKLITKQNQDRFFIYTSPDDKLLMQLIKDVDIVVVPYLEVGQSGSGVASMAVQFGKRVVFSDTYCSRELFYFLNRRPVIFDTQSGASFLYALKLAMQDEQKSLFFHNYNFDTNIKTYLESIKFN
jgi:glycosyltransferase involved in cell wall biosynthesis